MVGTLGVPSGVLVFLAITTAALLLCWIETVRVLRREQRRAEELTEEIVMLREEFGPDRALSRLSDYRGPFWMVVNEILANPALGIAPSKSYDELSRRQAGIAAGPWDVFLSIIVIVCCAGGGFGACDLCVRAVFPFGFHPDVPLPLREPGAVWVGVVMIGLAIVGLVAMSMIRSQRARLAQRFTDLLQQIADAFRTSDLDGAEPDQRSASK